MVREALHASNDIGRFNDSRVFQKQCTSKNIIGYKGHTKITRPKRDGHRSPVEYFLLMEFCPGGTMTSYLDSRHGQPFPEQQVLCMALDICEGVRALHSQPQPICHRDLKLDNVLLASDKTWKLCDFGSSTTRIKAYGTKEEITLEEETIQKYTTPSYRAPGWSVIAYTSRRPERSLEMANLWQRKVVGPKADIWVCCSAASMQRNRAECRPTGARMHHLCDRLPEAPVPGRDNADDPEIEHVLVRVPQSAARHFHGRVSAGVAGCKQHLY